MERIAKRVHYSPRHSVRLDLGNNLRIRCLPNANEFLLVRCSKDEVEVKKLSVSSKPGDRATLIPSIDCTFRHMRTTNFQLMHNGNLSKCVVQVDAEPVFEVPHSSEESKLTHIVLTFGSPLLKRPEVRCIESKLCSTI